MKRQRDGFQWHAENDSKNFREISNHLPFEKEKRYYVQMENLEEETE